jgi:predicted O-methyltransferase YrrM
MDDDWNLKPPETYEEILSASAALGFGLGSERVTGSLLRTLAAGKPGGRMLEIGTGTGMGTCWLLDGMDTGSRLISVDNDAAAMAVAIRFLGRDQRVAFRLEDAAATVEWLEESQFELIFADSFVGKYSHLGRTLKLLKPAGIYVIDDMLPQPTWPADHAPKVERLLAELEAREDLVLTKMKWASGIVVAVKR